MNWNNLVLAASRLLFGWQSILVGQSVLLEGDKGVLTEMLQECVRVCHDGGLRVSLPVLSFWGA